MKKYSLILILIGLLYILTGCRTNRTAEETAEDIIKKAYTINNDTPLVKFFMESQTSDVTPANKDIVDVYKKEYGSWINDKALEQCIANLLIGTLERLCTEYHFSMEADEITLTPGGRNDDPHDWNYAVTVAISFSDGSQRELETTGIIQMEKTDNEWKACVFWPKFDGDLLTSIEESNDSKR